MRDTKISSIISGFLGATASLFGKMAFGPSFVTPAQSILCSFSYFSSSSSFIDNNWCNSSISLLFRGIFVGLMVITNAFMISKFMDGMKESGSLVASSLSMATNFLSSSLFGVLFFDESDVVTDVNWLFGFGMILLGTWILSTVKSV